LVKGFFVGLGLTVLAVVVLGLGADYVVVITYSR
jgi:hypothetical protein